MACINMLCSSPPWKISKGRRLGPLKVSVGDTITKAHTHTVKKKNPTTSPYKSKHHPNPTTHSMPSEKLELFKHLEPWVHDNILPLLKPITNSWQPQEFLPDASTEGFFEQVHDLQSRAKEIPDDCLVCLVGDMITEEALPTYQTWINGLDGVGDDTGDDPSSWGTWTRGWTAEENRHGDLLNKYLYLSGRVDMKAVERTVQYLIGSGMNLRTENNPYMGFIYTSFQERATFISHGNTGRLAKQHGDVSLAQICGTIASDEKRHESAYIKIVEKLFEIDPNYTVLALSSMMRKNITMPAHYMHDGVDFDLFAHFSSVAQRTGVYTAKDYADVFEYLMERWKVAELDGLTSEGKEAQEYLCTLGHRLRRLEEREKRRGGRERERVSFSWIYGRGIQI